MARRTFQIGIFVFFLWFCRYVNGQYEEIKALEENDDELSLKLKKAYSTQSRRLPTSFENFSTYLDEVEMNFTGINMSLYVPPHRQKRTRIPLHRFEGVDYNDLPDGHLYDNNNDCDAYHNQCIRDEPFHQVVCAYDRARNEFLEYYSVCQIELENCWDRFDRKIPMRGRHRHDEYLFYTGDGYDCQRYSRRGNIEETYFDTTKTRRSAQDTSDLLEMKKIVEKQIEIHGKPKIITIRSMRAVAHILNDYKQCCP